MKINIVAISLFYSLKTTMLQKFGNLLVTYVRVQIENDKNLALFENAVKIYEFDLLGTEVSDVINDKVAGTSLPHLKNKF